MQYVYRFNVKPGKSGEFREWLQKNDSRLREHISDGWEFVGVYFTVQGFGRFDAEYRANLSGYEALGADRDAETEKLIAEFFTDWVDNAQPSEANLLKAQADVKIPEGL